MFGSFEGSPSVSFIFLLDQSIPIHGAAAWFHGFEVAQSAIFRLAVSFSWSARRGGARNPQLQVQTRMWPNSERWGFFFWPSCRGSKESLIHLCLLSPPDTPAVTGQCSVTRQGQRRRCWDEWKCGECGRNTHTHSISLCNVISGEAASCCFDLILTLSRWPGTVRSLSQIFVDSVLNSNPKWI